MSERQPWEADHDLPDATIVAAVEACAPDLAPVRFERLGRGWDFDAILVNDAWVFRFPRREKHASVLIREIELLRRLDGRLPLRIPRYVYGPAHHDDFPHPYAGYPFIAGTELVHLEPTPERRLAVANQLGPFLQALHDIPASEMEDLPPSPFTTRSDTAEVRQLLSKWAPCVDGFASADVVRMTRAFFEDDIDVPPSYDGPPYLKHNDLHNEHVLMGGEGDLEIMAIIDWSDAALGDPAGDYAELVTWGGEPMLDELLAHCAFADDALRTRAAYFAILATYPGIAWFRERGWDRAALNLANNLPPLLSAWV